MPLLRHRECNGSLAEVDPSKRAVISGTDLWYYIRCSDCHAQLGLLANVESPEHVTFLSTEEYNRCPKVQ